jgi:outer membrane protein OmpA-like peptidoglycan-associated protein
MTRWGRIAFAGAVVAAACGPQSGPRTPGGAELVVLTADPAGGTGQASVTTARGSVDLTTAGAAAHVASASAPVVTAMSDADVTRVFGDTFASLPPAPQSGILYFSFESDRLTPESEALVPKMVQAVLSRSVPEVLIVGHTDTTGDPAANRTLGLERATAVRSLLIGAGLAPSLVEVVSHGESELLIATPDNTPEPRNRRVEITVR